MYEIYLWCPGKEINLIDDLEDYINQRTEFLGHEGKATEARYIQIKTQNDQSPNFSNLEVGSTLILHLHGSSSNTNNNFLNPLLYIDAHTINTVENMAAFIIKCGLNRKHQTLKLAACHSDQFAKSLQIRLESLGYKELSVYGYKGEYCLGAGENSTNLVGLSQEHLINQDGLNMLNRTAIKSYGVNYFKSTNYRVCYGPNALVANAETAASYEKYVTNSIRSLARPTTRLSISASRPNTQEGLIEQFNSLQINSQSIQTNSTNSMSFLKRDLPLISFTNPKPAHTVGKVSEPSKDKPKPD